MGEQTRSSSATASWCGIRLKTDLVTSSNRRNRSRLRGAPAQHWDSPSSPGLLLSDPLVRLVAVAIVVAVAVGFGRWRSRSVGGGHPLVDLAGTDLPNGLVIFTSTDCAKCKDAVATLKNVGAPVREVSWELEPAIQQQAAIESVPLTVVRDKRGATVAQFAGVPSSVKLRRAVKRAGW